MQYILPGYAGLIVCKKCGTIVGYKEKDLHYESSFNLFDLDNPTNVTRVYVKCPYCSEEQTIYRKGSDDGLSE